MKKLIITMGAFTALAAPIATVVACGNNSKSTSTPPKPDPSVYKYPTLGEMFEDPMGLAKLFDAKIVNESASPDDDLKTSLKAAIADDAAAAKIEGTNSSEHNTKATWDSYVDTKLKMRELYEISSKNLIMDKSGWIPKSLELPESALTKDNTLFISSSSTKEQMISSVNSIWKSNKKLSDLYTNFIKESKLSQDVYYALKFMRATSTAKNLIGQAGAITAVDADIYKTKSEQITFIKNLVLDGTMKIKEIAESIKAKFSGNAEGLNFDLIKQSAEIIGNKFYRTLFWKSASPAMGGDEVVKYMLTKVGISFAADGEKKPTPAI